MEVSGLNREPIKYPAHVANDFWKCVTWCKAESWADWAPISRDIRKGIKRIR